MKFNKFIFSKIIPIIFIFIYIFNFSFGDNYIPQNKNEEEIIERFREKKIIIGLNSHDFYERKSKYNNKSINDIFIELFRDYLNLEIALKRGTSSTLLNEEDKNVDIISFITDPKKSRSNLIFSNSIYSDAVYIISSDMKISSLDDLQGENIYVSSEYSYIELLERYLFNNNIESKIVEVNDISKYSDRLILTDNPVIFNPISGLKISSSSQSAVGIKGELKDLLPVINRALDSKYTELLNEQIYIIKKEITLENLDSYLTKAESKYLMNLKTINIKYNKNLESDLYYTSKLENNLKGIIPDITQIIFKALELDINTSDNDYSDELSEENSINLYIRSKTMEQSKDLIFTETLYNLPIYNVKLKNKSPMSSETLYNIPVYNMKLKNHSYGNSLLGVVSDSIESETIKKYNIYKMVRLYPTYESLIDALNNCEIDEVLTQNTNILSEKKYDILLFERVPVSLALKKKDEYFRDIINKSILKLIPLEDVINNSIIEKSNEDLYILNQKNYKKRSVIIYSIGLLIMLLLSFIKIISDKRYKVKLLKDPLSQLPNRIVFNEFCINKSNSLKGYAIIIDFDNFKELNDNYGHEVGDMIISELSDYLRDNFDAKFIFRISGDEFYGVLDRKLEEIIDILKNYHSFCPLMKKYNISFSLGIYKKRLNSFIRNDFKYADMAMFEAKKIKGFSYKVADKEFIRGKKREGDILEILNGEVKEIYPVFQPKVDLKSNKVIGAEALARCSSDTLGTIYPLEFIELAEKYNIIHKIDYKIAEDSIKFIRERMDKNEIDDGFRLSINISVKTFKRNDLIDTITKCLEKYQVPGKYIEIEITESVLMINIKDILYKLNKFIDLGVQISLDDFTAGHSTASLLPILPLSIVKFDKSLLDLFNKNEEKGKIVYLNLISLIKELDLKIVAEGIECEKEIKFLKDSGVDYGQGYLLGKPDTYQTKKIMEIETI